VYSGASPWRPPHLVRELGRLLLVLRVDLERSTGTAR
jgi:hypothetical protein